MALDGFEIRYSIASWPDTLERLEEVDERKAASGLLRRRCEATLACGDKADIGTTTPDASDVADPVVADEPLLPPSRAFLRSLALMF